MVSSKLDYGWQFYTITRFGNPDMAVKGPFNSRKYALEL